MSKEPLTGNLEERLLPYLIQDCFLEKTSGVLDLQHGMNIRRISFIEGEVRSARSNTMEQRVGQFLVRSKAIDHTQLMKALAQRESSAPLGKRLVQMGFITEGVLTGHLRKLAREIIFDCYGWTSGQYRFYLGKPSLPVDVLIPVATADIVFQGFKRFATPAMAREVIGDFKLILDANLKVGGILGRITLEQRDALILARINGKLSASQILGLLPGQLAENLVSLAALIACSLVSVRGQPARTSPAKLLSQFPGMTQQHGLLQQSAVQATHQTAKQQPNAPAPHPPQPLRHPQPSPQSSKPSSRQPRPGEVPAPRPVKIPRHHIPQVELTRRDIEIIRKNVIRHFQQIKANHYQFLGLPVRATQKEIRSVYYNLRFILDRDKIARPEFDDLRQQITAVDQRLEKAYAVLSNQEKRSQYNQSLGYGRLYT